MEKSSPRTPFRNLLLLFHHRGSAPHGEKVVRDLRKESERAFSRENPQLCTYFCGIYPAFLMKISLTSEKDLIKNEDTWYRKLM